MSSAGYTHGQSAYVIGQSDPRYVRYTAPEQHPSLLAGAPALEKRWAGKRDGSAAATAETRAPVAAPREEPVVATGAVHITELQQPGSSPVTAASGTATRRTLWDKQPWEIELDKTVRSICRGC